MNAKLILICTGAITLVSFNLVKEENFQRDSKLDHIDFSINPSGNEFVKPCNEKAELQMIEKINALRIKNGLKALKYDAKLTLAARIMQQIWPLSVISNITPIITKIIN